MMNLVWKRIIFLFLKLSNETAILSKILDRWNLTDDSNKLLSQVSQGLKYRTALACTFLGNFQSLLLDEPTTALDENALSLLSNQINFAKDKSVVIASHDFLRLSHLVNRILILDGGSLVHDEKLDDSEDRSEYINSVYLKFRK